MEGIGDSSTSESAWSSFRPYKVSNDTIPLTRIPDKISDSVSETSEISVLTQEQEIQLRRKRKHTSKPLSGSMELEDGQAFLDNWNPGFNIHDKAEEHKKRVSWPVQDRLASTLRTTIGSGDTVDLRKSTNVANLGDSLQSEGDDGEFRKLGERPRSFDQSMEVIPEDTRKQTPRATAFSNKMMLGTGGESLKSYDFSNLQDNKNGSNSTNAYLQELNHDMKKKDTQEARTRGNIGRTGPKLPQTTPKHLLSATMRDGLRQISQDEARPYIKENNDTFEDRLQDDTFEDRLQDVRRKMEIEELKDRSLPQCWWKSLLFVLIVGLIIAAIISVSVLYRAEEKHTNSTVSIIPNPEVTKVCQGTTLKLGEKIQFQCDFVIGHEARGKFKPPIKLTVIPPNKVSPGGFSAVRLDYSFNITGPETTCSSTGRYILEFRNDQNYIFFTSHVFLYIEDGHVTTSVKQTGQGRNNATFIATCTLVNDCVINDFSFAGSKQNATITLDDEKQCRSSFSNKHGYNTTCTTLFTGNKTDFTAMYPACQWSRYRRTLQLPSCLPSTECSHSCTSYVECDCSNVQECFSPRLFVFTTSSGVCTLGRCQHNNTEMTALPVKDALRLRNQTAATSSYSIDTTTTTTMP